jgi:hypothetical protein
MRRPYLLSSIASLLVIACGTSSPPTQDATEGETTAAEGEDTQAIPPVVSDDTTGSSTSGIDPDSDPTLDSSGSSEEEGFIPRPDMGGRLDGFPLGEMCEADRDCDSNACFFIVPGFGICSECALDSDCMIDGAPGTCGFSGAQPWGTCTDGSAGSMCQSSEGCQPDLVCALFSEGSPISFCSECDSDEMCERGMLCSPTFTGQHTCVVPGTVELGELCPAEGSIVCASGHCTQARSNGNPSGLWLCGECTLDEDCAEGQTCQAATVGMMDVTPSVCV